MSTFQFKNFPKSDQSPTPWEIWRHAGIDAEDAATLTGENPWESKAELLERKSQLAPTRKPATPAMEAGRLLRPEALRAYRNLAGIQALAPRNAENSTHPWMIAHPDLIDPASGHIAEVHCGESALRKALATGKTPKPYWAEAQHTLAVTGFRFLHLYLHSPTPELQSKVIKIWASAGFQKDLITEESAFVSELREARSALEIQHRLRESAALIRATMAAIRQQGPRVTIETFRSLVPKFLDRKGNPTEAGQSRLSLLLAA